MNMGIKKGEKVNEGIIGEVRMGKKVEKNEIMERKGERIEIVKKKGFRDEMKIGYKERKKIFEKEIIKKEEI